MAAGYLKHLAGDRIEVRSAGTDPGDKVNPAQYGYLSGKAVGGSGFLRVTTAGASVKVEFVKFDGSIADSYEKIVSG